MILGSPYVIIGGIAVSFLLGWNVHDWRTEAREKAAIEEALAEYKTGAENEMKKQRDITKGEVDRSDRLASDLQDVRRALSDAMLSNATLAASRAASNTRIVERGEVIGNELEGNNPCIREPWPDGLRIYANGYEFRTTKGFLPSSEKAGDRQTSGWIIP